MKRLIILLIVLETEMRFLRVLLIVAGTLCHKIIIT